MSFSSPGTRHGAPIIASLLLWLACLIPAGDTVAETLEETLPRLADRSFAVKQAAIESIAASPDERALNILVALAAGDLYTRTQTPSVVLGLATSAGRRLTDPLTGADLGEATPGAAKKIILNNAMRVALRVAIASRRLSSPDPAERLSAAREMRGDTSPAAVAALSAQLEREQDAEVRAAITLALAVARLGSSEPSTRLEAVAALEDSLYPEARNALRPVAESDPDPEVRKAAAKTLTGIEQRLAWNARAETLFFGLSLGSVLVLAAIGLAITFGVMGVINMAHGELMMLGAYTAYLVQSALPGWIDYSLFLAIPAAFIVSGLFGIAIERTVIRFLYGRPLETLLATFGISLILQQLVRTLISAQNVVVQNPSWMSGAWSINPALALTYNRLFILLFALLVFAALLLILKRTALGLEVRAVSQNRAMARAMGVRSERVDALTFGLGAGIAGVAGVALSQLTNVGPNMGQAYIIDSFMVVVFGGVGNLWGTLVAGMSLGVANKLMEPWAGAVLAKILVLVFIILFIQKRPRGLFPQRGRAAEG
ncbi:urea ABC transporter permease subunit UrtB [Thiocystis violascens]|uniref:Amino acid/amide ABC transporter membrane protein 1, HAAT family n=1 Tax=Thiocystis violascens (strain ATCC 17096 / DSM 198 / 6111) TaxID=765911 RepID=I3YAM6_THIV6|nr:urea ABC transporter permease subunit UrtB [Thiocystis violascens]AFL74044.1 amino acid/amide ABC transporter membrane protein 1, HAAT family [Thiocystis violascens DSM 198]